MNKKIKIIISSILIAIVCLLVLFFKPVLSYGIIAYLNSHAKNYEKSSLVTFKKFEMKNRKIFLKDVNISAKDKYSIEIDRLDIGFKFHFFRPKIITDIFISKPNITVYKNDHFDFSYKASKKSFFSTLINIEKANINFVDQKTLVKQLIVDLSNINENSSKLELFFNKADTKKICVDINRINKKDVFSLYLDEIEMSNINKVFNFFNMNLFQDLKGISNGIMVIGVEKGKICKFFTNLDFVNFSFLNPTTNLKFDCKNFRVETNFPDAINQKHTSFLDFLKYDFLKETQIRLNFENLTVLTSKKSNFSKIEGSFSYNPNLGSKLNILGKIENEKSFDFQINSKAYSASSFANWLDFNFSFDNNKTKICFSAKEINDFYNLHLSFDNIKPHIFKAFQDLSSKSIKELDDFKYIDGDLSFCIDTRINRNGISKVFLTDLLIKDLDFQKDNIKGFISKVEGKSSFDLSKKNFLDKFFSDIKISPSNFDINKKQIKDFRAKIFAIDGAFQSSSIACFIENIETKAAIKGPIKTFSASIFAKGILPNMEDSFISDICLKRKLNNYQISGNCQVLDGQEMVFGFDLEKLLIFNLQELKTSIQKLWLRAEKLKLNKWPKIIDSDLLIDGIANIAIFYDKDKLSFQIKGENLSYRNQYIDLRMDKIGNLNDFVFEGDNFINGTFDNNVLICDIFDFQGRCFLPKFDLDFDVKNAKIKVDDNVLIATVESKAQDVDFNGFVSFDFSKTYPLLNIETDFSSNIKSMQNLFKKFDYSNELQLLGDVSASGKITTYFDTDTKTYYSLDFVFFDAAYQINEKTFIKNIEAKAKATSDDIFSFSNFMATLEVGSQKYNISCPIFEKINDNIYFDFRLEKQTFDFLRLVGLFVKKDNTYELDLDKTFSHIASENVKDLKLSIDKNFNVNNFHFSSNLNAYSFISMLQFVVDSSSIFMDDVNINSIIQSKYGGDLLTTCDLKDNKDLYFELKSKNFQILDKKLDNFCLKGKKTSSLIEIQKLMFNDFESALFMNIDQNKLKIYDWTLKRKDELFLKMNGTYVQNTSSLNTNISDIKIDLKKIRPLLSNFVQLPKASIEGHLKGNGICHFHMPKEGERIKILADIDFEPSNLNIEKLRLYNSGSLNVNFSSESGFLIQGLDFSFYSKDIDLSYLTCKIGQISYDLNSKNYFLKDSNIYIPQCLKQSFEKLDKFKSICKYIKLDDDIDLICDIQFASDLSRIEIFSNKTCFAIKGKKYTLKDLYLDLRDKNCLLSFDYFHKNNFYKIKNDFNFDKEIVVKTSFHEEKSQNIKPLQISWIVDKNKNLLIKEMVGSFCGTDFMFQEDIDKLNSNKLFGSLKIDNTKLQQILPKNIEDILKRHLVGSGYEISGSLSFNFSKPHFINFEGLFSGKDFELLGYQFKTMFAKFKILENIIQISDFKISDQAGIVTINEIIFQKNNNKWQLNMPILKIKDLRPSLMKPINKPLKEMTPFLIRELILKDFKGNLENKNSFSGNGYFHFINSFKRGHSVFDFPADVLSRIVGIDQELLTPVTGKMVFDVKNAKFNLSKLTDSFSEAERSKFFLLGKGQKHYIDFDGNIYLNIAMKQYVLFKFTESFVISIRGNLNDPQFNLKKKRGFLLN